MLDDRRHEQEAERAGRSSPAGRSSRRPLSPCAGWLGSACRCTRRSGRAWRRAWRSELFRAVVDRRTWARWRTGRTLRFGAISLLYGVGPISETPERAKPSRLFGEIVAGLHDSDVPCRQPHANARCQRISRDRERPPTRCGGGGGARRAAVGGSAVYGGRQLAESAFRSGSFAGRAGRRAGRERRQSDARAAPARRRWSSGSPAGSPNAAFAWRS